MYIIPKLKDQILCNAFCEKATREQHYTKREKYKRKWETVPMIESLFPFYHPSISILSLTFFSYLISSFIHSHLEYLIQDVLSHFCPSIYSYVYSFLHKEGLFFFGYSFIYRTPTHQWFGVTVLFSDVTEVPRYICLEPDVLSVQSWFLLKHTASN